MNIFETNKEKATACYQSNTAFTEFIMPKVKEILEKHGEKTQEEYFRIDCIGWRQNSSKFSNSIPSGFEPHCWDLDVAVEHENNPADWLDEVVKLAHIRCELRVVIGYVPIGRNDNEYLNYTAESLMKLKCKENVKQGAFLVILGNSNTKSEKGLFRV